MFRIHGTNCLSVHLRVDQLWTLDHNNTEAMAAKDDKSINMSLS